MKLIHVFGKTFAVQTDRFIAVGTLAEARAYLVDCGVRDEEIAFALNEFERNGHNVADIGITGGVTFTTTEDISDIVEQIVAAPRREAA